MASFESIWSEKGASAWMLSPLGGLYAFSWWAYQGIYTLGLKKAASPHKEIITIGNLMAGGTGKTPTTLFVAEKLRELGHEPIIGVSGYGSPSAHDARIAPDGELDAHEYGDEAAMMRWFVPNQDLVIGRNRVMAAELVHQKWPERILLMDDGFQHLRLRQPVSIILDPNPDNNFCLPAGPYREPRMTGLRRADLFIPNETYRWSRGVTQFKQVNGESRKLAGARVNVLCALARPARLVEALTAEGYELGHVRLLPDHDTMTDGNLLSDFEPDVPLIVTAKDWVKVRRRSDLGNRTIYSCWYEVRIDPEESFKEWLRDRLNGVH